MSKKNMQKKKDAYLVKNVVYNYFSFSNTINDLGSELTWRNIKLPCLLFILGSACILSFLHFFNVSIKDVPMNCSYMITSCICFLASVGFYFACVLLLNSTIYIRSRFRLVNKHILYIEYLLRAYLVNKTVVDLRKMKKMRSECLENELKKLSDKKIVKSVNKADIDYLLVKVKDEWNEYEKRAKKSVVLIFLVMIVSTVVAIIKEAVSVYIWVEKMQNISEAENSYVSMTGNVVAIFTFVIVLLVGIRLIKQIKDYSNTDKARNYEYLYTSLLRIQTLLTKTKVQVKSRTIDHSIIRR